MSSERNLFHAGWRSISFSVLPGRISFLRSPGTLLSAVPLSTSIHCRDGWVGNKSTIILSSLGTLCQSCGFKTTTSKIVIMSCTTLGRSLTRVVTRQVDSAAHPPSRSSERNLFHAGWRSISFSVLPGRISFLRSPGTLLSAVPLSTSLRSARHLLQDVGSSVLVT